MTSLAELGMMARRLAPAELDETRSTSHHRHMVQVGVVWEMCHPIKPSNEELGRTLLVSKSYAQRLLSEWREIHWRDRYAWLQLAERRIHEAQPVDAALLR